MSIELKAELSKFFRTRGDFETVEMIRWICHDFGNHQADDYLIKEAETAERAFASWLDSYDPTPYETPDGGNVTEENYQRAAKQKRELDR